MNLNQPERLELLAASYTLGVLRHRARARFERLCVSSTSARIATQLWEDRLLPLALELPMVAPSTALWPRIQQRIAAGRDQIGVPADLDQRRRGRRWWQVAAAASVIAITLLVGKLTIWHETAWQAFAVLAQAHAAPSWRVERSPDTASIYIHTIASITLEASKDYELWVLPRVGQPVSLGLLPRSGNLQRKLTTEQRRMLLTALQVAVSVEPAGGSPTGLPTGPVIVVAPIVRMT